MPLITSDPQAAVAGIRDGATILVGGFGVSLAELRHSSRRKVNINVIYS
jgi:acyl CoA:acetate/3-ketoacid CoA transferase alpha subunit